MKKGYIVVDGNGDTVPNTFLQHDRMTAVKLAGLENYIKTVLVCGICKTVALPVDCAHCDGSGGYTPTEIAQFKKSL